MAAIDTNPILAQARKEVKTVAPVTISPEAVAPIEIGSTIDAVQSALNKSSARIATSVERAEKGLADTEQLTSVIKGAISDATAVTQITAKTAMNAELQAQTANIELFAAAGGQDAQVALIKTQREEGDRLAELLDVKTDIVNDKFTGVGLIDVIINSFRTIQVDEEIKTVAAEKANTDSQVQNIAASQESFARVNAQTKKTVNEGVIEANYKGIEAEGALKASEAELKNVRSNATAFNSIIAADQNQVNNLVQAFRLEGEAAQRELQKERQKFQKEQMEFNREKFKVQLPQAKVNLESSKLQLDEAKLLTPDRRAAAEANFAAAVKRHDDLVALESQQTDFVQRAQSAFGLPVEPRETVAFNIRQGGPVGLRYATLAFSGSNVNPSLGSTAADANTSLLIIDPISAAPQNKGTGLLMAIRDKQGQKYLDRNKPGGLPIPKDKATLDSDFNATAKEVMSAFEANIVSTDNPYHAPPMASLDPLLANKGIILYDKVIKPQGLQEVNPQTILDAAINGVLAKTITPQQAATGIVSIFTNAAMFNNTTEGGFTRVGLPPQDTYNTPITKPMSLLPGAAFAAKSFLPGNLLRRATGEGLPELVAEFVQSGLETVDLMDSTKVVDLIIRKMSETAPVNPATPTTTPNSPAPKPTQEGDI